MSVSERKRGHSNAGVAQRHDQGRPIGSFEWQAGVRRVRPVDAWAAVVRLDAASTVLSDDLRVVFVAGLGVELALGERVSGRTGAAGVMEDGRAACPSTWK